MDDHPGADGDHPAAAGAAGGPTNTIVIEREGRITWASDDAGDVLGVGADHLVGSSLEEIAQPGDQEGLARARARLDAGLDAMVMLHAQADTGEVVAIEARLRPGPDGMPGADVVSTLAPRRGITERGDAVLHALAELAHRAGDLLFLVDGHSRIIEASGRADELLGWPTAEMIGLTLPSFIHPDDQVDLAAYREDLQAGRPVDSIEVRARTRGGTWRWFLATGLLVGDVADEPTRTRVLVSWRGIDQLVRETRFAERETARLRAILDASLDPWLMLCPLRDRRGQVTDFMVEDANEAAATYLQWPRTRILGARIVREFPGLVAHGLISAYVAAIDEGVPVVLHDLVYPHEVFGETRRYEIRAQAAAGSLLLTWRDTTPLSAEREKVSTSEAEMRATAAAAGDAVVRVGAGIIRWASPGAEAMGLQKGASFTAAMDRLVTAGSAAGVSACALAMSREPGYAGRWEREGQPSITVRARPTGDEDDTAVVTVIEEEWTAGGTRG